MTNMSVRDIVVRILKVRHSEFDIAELEITNEFLRAIIDSAKETEEKVRMLKVQDIRDSG